MSSFNAEQYFRERAQTLLNDPSFTNPTPVFTNKAEEVAYAAEQKKIDLWKQQAIAAQATLERNNNSLVGQLGLDPNSGIGGVLDTLVATGDELAKVPGYVAEGIHLAKELAIHQNIPEAAEAAYQRKQQGIATPEDLAILQMPYGTTAPDWENKLSNYEKIAMRQQGYRTNLEHIESRNQARTDRETIKKAFDNSDLVGVNPETHQKNSGLVHRLAVDPAISLVKSATYVPETAVGIASLVSGGKAGKALEEAGFRPEEARAFLDSLKSAEQQYADKSVHGAEGFWNTMAEIAENPSVVPHALIESLFPMLAGGLAGRGLQALGIAGRTATALGEGTVIAGSAAEGIRNQTKDGELSLKQALLAGGSGLGGAAISRLTGGIANKLGLGDIDEAIVAGTLGKSKMNPVVHAVGSGTTESIEETGQSSLEAVLQNLALDRPYDQGVGNAAAMGAVTGFAMGTPMGAAQRAAEDAQDTAKRAEETTSAMTTALQSGDVSAFINEKSPTYDPAKAVQILYAYTTQEGVTPEVKASKLAEAADIVTTLENKLDTLKIHADRYSPETLEKVKDKIRERNEVLKATDKNDTARIEEVQGHIEGLKDILRKSKSDEVKSIPKQIQSLEEQIKLSKEITSGITGNVNLSTPQEDIDTLTTTATAVVDEQDTAGVASKQEAAKKVLSLSMRGSNRVSEDTLNSLASDNQNGLSENERTYLKDVVAAQQKINALKTQAQVHQEVLGDPKSNNLGITDYQRMVHEGIASGSDLATTRALNLLSKFVSGHKDKLTKISAWYNEAVSSGTSIQVKPVKGKGWVRLDAPVSDKALRDMGGLTISAASVKLLKIIQTEVDALDQTEKSLKGAYSLSFKQNPVSTSSVTPTPVAPVATSTPSVAPAATNTVSSPTPVSKVDAGDMAQEQTTNPAPATSTELSSKRAPHASPIPAADTPVEGQTHSTEQDSVDTAQSEQGTSKQASQQVPEEPGQQTNPVAKALVEGKVETLIQRVRKSLNKQALEQTLEAISGPMTTEDATWAPFINDTFDAEAVEKAVNQLWVAIENRLDELDNTLPDVTGIDDVVAGIQDPETGELSQEEIARLISVIEANLERTSNENQDTSGTDNQGTENNQEHDAGTTEEDSGLAEETGESSEDVAGEDETVEAAGKLEVFNVPPRTGESIFDISKNGALFSTFFRQSVKGLKAVQRPLVAVVDFLSKWGKEVNAVDFLPEEFRNPSREQKQLSNLFRAKAKEWMPLLVKSLATLTDAQKAYAFRDPFTELVFTNEEGKLDLPENVKTAMIYAAFSWLMENGSRPTTKTNEQINKLLARHPEDVVLPLEREIMAEAVTRKNTLVNALGSRALKALGISAKDDAPKNMLPVLEANMGEHIYEMLLQADMIKPLSITTQDLMNASEQPSFDLEERSESFDRQEFIGLNLDKVKEITNAAKGTKGILDALFSVESEVVMPTFEPTEFSQKVTEEGMEVPKVLAETLQNHNAQKHLIKESVYDAFFKLGLETQVRIASGEWVTEDTQAMLVSSIEARNGALENEIQKLAEFMEYYIKEGSEDPYAVPIYFQHRVWNQFRVGVDGTINMQMSKIARHLFKREGWESKITMESGSKSFDIFKLRVLEALGVKTNNKSSTEALKYMPELFVPSKERKTEILDTNTQKIDKAVDILLAQMETGMGFTAEEESILVDAVSTGGEKMLSFDALVALAEMRHAQNNGQTSFTTAFIGEIDGVNNGPLMAHFFYGAAEDTDALLRYVEKGGIYTEESGALNYNDWRSRSENHDIYESITRTAYGILQQNINELPQIFAEKPFMVDIFNKKYAAVQFFIGELIKDGKVTSEGRNLSKEPVRPLVFGSGVDKAIANMSQSFIDNIAKHLSVVAADPVKRKAAITQLNRLLYTKEKDLYIPTNISKEELLALKLTTKQIKAISDTFVSTFGAAYESAIKEDLGVFLERRKQIIKTSQLISKLFMATYKALRNEYIKSLGIETKQVTKLDEAGNKVLDKDGNPVKIDVPLYDLSLKQEREFHKRIEKIFPRVHTFFSRNESNNKAGLPVYKFERALSQNPLYSPEVHLSGKRTRNPHAMAQEISDVGVRLVSMPIHSLDSWISHTANPLGKFINLHDAGGTGMDSFLDMGKALNAALWKAMVNYSPLKELEETLENTVNNVADLLKRSSKHMDTESRNALLRALAEEFSMSDGFDLLGTLTDINSLANGVEIMRLDAADRVVALDQYASEGARYEPTLKDKEDLKEKRKNAVKEISNKVLTSIQLIKNMVNPVLERVDAGVVAKTNLEDGITALNRMPGNKIQQALRAEGQSLSKSNEAENALRAPLITLIKKLREGVSFKQALADLNLDNEVVTDIVERIQYRLNNIAKIKRDLGKPINKSAPNLVEFFKDKDYVSAEKLIAFLETNMADYDSGFKGFYKELLQQIKPLVPKDLRIVYVTAATDPSLMLDSKNDPGWYVSNTETGERAIYILGQDYKNSEITSELLLHELVHAALAATIENPKDAKATQLVNSLSTLMKDIQASAKKNPELQASLAKFDAAMGSVHEFVSYGLTNKAFQDQVLRKVQVAQKNKTSKHLKTGLRQFVSKISEFLFNKKIEELSDEVLALEAFMTYAGGLFAAAPSMMDSRPTVSLSMQGTNTRTTTEIFDNLSGKSNNPAFEDKQKALLSGIVNAVYGLVGTVGSNVVFQNSPSIEDAWNTLVQTGTVPFASRIPSNIKTTSKEAFVIEQVEATVRTVIADKDAQTLPAMRELKKLYQEARTALKGVLPQDEYDFVFGFEQNPDGTSDYLSRFVALGLGHEGINQALLQITATKRKAPKGFIEQLESLFQDFLEWVAQMRTHTTGNLPAGHRLNILASQLVNLDTKRKNQSQAKPNAFIASMEQGASNAVNKAKNVVIKAATSNFVQKHTTGFGKLAGSAVAIVAGGHTQHVLNFVADMKAKAMKDHKDLVFGLIKDVSGFSKPVFDALLRAANRNEQVRQQIHTVTASTVLSSFNVVPSSAENASLTRTLLRTGAHALLGNYSLNDLSQFLGNPAALRRAIEKEEQQLTSGSNSIYYMNMSQMLGYYLATGHSKSNALVLNSKNISLLYGTPKPLSESAQTRNAEEVINRLASLYALSYMADLDKSNVRNVLLRELARTDGGNGVKTLLELHKSFEEQSRNELFVDKEALMTKGYTSEIYNHYLDVKAATLVEGKELEEKGYVRGAVTEKDPSDPDQTPVFLYTLEHGGLSRWASGALSIKGEGTKGTTVHNGFLSPYTANGVVNIAVQGNYDSARNREVRTLMSKRVDPATVAGTRTVPVLNAQGAVVNYRYTMQEKTKDIVLQRDNRMEEVLGKLAGSIFDKKETPKQNAKVIDALKEVYDAEYAKHPERFVRISHSSTDPEIQETYALIPEEARKQIRDLWGTDGIIMPKELVYPIFGYRKRSLATIFERDLDKKEHLNRMFVYMVEGFLRLVAHSKGKNPDAYAKKAALFIRRIEAGSKEVVDELKDWIVIRSLVVGWDNIKSNIGLLFAYGVSPKELIRHQAVAWRAGWEYQDNSNALRAVEAKLLMNPSPAEKAELEKQRIYYMNEISRSPVQELIENGMMPTIVEDVANTQDIYSYKSYLAQRVSEYTDNVPEALKTTGKWAVLAKDTAAYSHLRRVTALSDFTARYVLYKHLTEIKKMDKDAALYQASEAFVNYDRHMHPVLQYMDDHGLMLFTKYLMRIQRIIMQVVQGNPLRVLMLVLVDNYLGNIAPVTDSSIVTRIGDWPFDDGPFGALDAFEQIATVEAAMSIIK